VSAHPTTVMGNPNTLSDRAAMGLPDAFVDRFLEDTGESSFTRFADLARCRRRHGWYDRDIYAIGFRLAESL
jgi:hypothetical protein